MVRSRRTSRISSRSRAERSPATGENADQANTLALPWMERVESQLRRLAARAPATLHRARARPAWLRRRYDAADAAHGACVRRVGAPPCRCAADRSRRGWWTLLRDRDRARVRDRKSTRLNSSHLVISYAVFCLKK